MKQRKKAMPGRPKLAKPRVKYVSVRLSSEELELIDKAIKKTGGTTRGKFVRALLLSNV